MPVRDRASALKFVTIGDRPFDPKEADRQRVRLLSGETNDTGGPLEYEPKPQSGQRPERISRTTCLFLGCLGCVLVAVAVGGVMSAFREQPSPPPPPKPLPPMSPPQPPLSPPRLPPPQTPPSSPPPFNQTWACFTCTFNATNTTSTSLTVRRKLSSLGLDYFPIFKVAVANFLGLPVGDVSITQDVSGMFTCCCESRNYTQLQYLLTTENSSDFKAAIESAVGTSVTFPDDPYISTEALVEAPPPPNQPTLPPPSPSPSPPSPNPPPFPPPPTPPPPTPHRPPPSPSLPPELMVASVTVLVQEIFYAVQFADFDDGARQERESQYENLLHRLTQADEIDGTLVTDVTPTFSEALRNPPSKSGCLNGASLSTNASCKWCSCTKTRQVRARCRSAAAAVPQ